MSSLGDMIVAAGGTITATYTEVAIYPDGTTKVLTHKSWAKDPSTVKGKAPKKKAKKESFDVVVDGEIEL